MRNLITLYRDPDPAGAPPAGAPPAGAPPAGAPPAGGFSVEVLNSLQGEAFRAILPEPVRTAGWMKDVNTFGDFVKKSEGAQALIGQRAVPAEDAKPEQWDAWFKQIGRPENPADYGVPVVEGVPKEYIEKIGEVGTLQKILHAGGVNKVMANSILSNLIKQTYTAEQAENQAAEAAHEKLMNETFKQDRQAVTENGKRYLAANLPANVVPFLSQLDDKQLAVVLAITDSVVKKFGQEDAFRGGNNTPAGGGVETKESLTAQMRAIMSQAEYQDPLKDKTKHAALQAEMEVIRGKLRKIG